ncbi:MAG: U32 family peptidase [Clostridia bacterium]|nr:U32 family peptidase [Clostridia bacterium]
MCELLAPAGSYESVMAAVNSGADAIYLGFPEFSARHAAGMDNETFLKVLETARVYGVKVYVALNTFVKDKELPQFLKDAVYSWNAGADALILQDIWLGAFIHERFPQIKLHLSTQAGVCNIYGARLAKKMGFSRVILARETPVEDIEEISKEIETECFIQGALCTCFSGQCYFSSFNGGCSGNRGMCKQPCRQKYTLGLWDKREPAYRLSLSDLSLGEDVQKLIDLGVVSLKIEGRLRRPEYVAAACNYYRAILDGKEVTPQLLSDLKRTYNRNNYTKGLAWGQPENFISSDVQGNMGEYVGKVAYRPFRKQPRLVVMTKEPLVRGDAFKILRNGKEVGGAAFGGVTRTGKGCVLSTRAPVQAGDDVYITTDQKLSRRLLSAKRLIDVRISLTFLAGATAKAIIDGQEYWSSFLLQPAVTQPLSVEDIKEAFLKTDTMPFSVSFGDIETDGVFMPKSVLNDFRRTVFAKYYASRTVLHRDRIPEEDIRLPSYEPYAAPKVSKKAACPVKTAVMCRDTEPYDSIAADIIILKPSDYNSISIIPCEGKEVYLYLPPYMSHRDLDLVKPAILEIGGIFAEGTYGLELAKELQVKLFAGPGFNITNRIDVLGVEADHITLSKEITNKEASEICTEKCFCLTAGSLKLMDLVYCPLGHDCATCKKQNFIGLTDSEDHTYKLIRYRTTECRFELYNYRSFAGTFGPCGRLYDFSLVDARDEADQLAAGKTAVGLYIRCDATTGHTELPTL